MPLAFTTGTSSHFKNTLHKRKFEFKVLLLLHILIPGVMLSSLETINPWLSACDLKQQQHGSSDFKGSCKAVTEFPSSSRTTAPTDVDMLCPKECQPNESKTNASCLAYLDETRRNAICNFNLGNGIEWLKSFLGTIRLRHCCEYKIIESLSGTLLERVLKGKEECFKIIDSLVDVDNLAARVTCGFSDVLSRYDCGQPYSVKFTCNDCLEAYRRWVCSTLVPYFNDTVRVRPCRSVCQAVEQKCPYFLPENKAPALPTQYAGEPTFLCMDPNIPEAGEQQRKSLYPDPEACCVKVCGSPKEGLCVENGSKCQSEDLISYDEASDQAVECTQTEQYGTRVPSLECTASEPYSSPHKLGSGSYRIHPGLPLIVSAFPIHQTLPRGFYFSIIFLLFYVFPISFIQLPLSLYLFITNLSEIRLWSTHVKVKLKLFFHYVKRRRFIFNYFKFNSKRWQYYFILISVNLLFVWFNKNPRPFETPHNSDNWRFKIKLKTRRARRHYYYYYYYYYYYFYYYIYNKYCYRHYYILILKIAQNSAGYVLPLRNSGGFKREITINVCGCDECVFRVIYENNSRASSIMILIVILKMIFITDFSLNRICGEMAEDWNWFGGRHRERTKMSEGRDKASVIFDKGANKTSVICDEETPSRLTSARNEFFRYSHKTYLMDFIKGTRDFNEVESESNRIKSIFVIKLLLPKFAMVRFKVWRLDFY